MDLGFFAQNGYQLIDDLFLAAELEPVRRFLDDEREASLATVRVHLPFESDADLFSQITRLLKDRARFEALPHQVRNVLSGHFRLEARLSPILSGLARSSRLREVLGEVFGARPLRMHMPPVARFVLPGNDFAGVPAHQDLSYNKHLAELVTMWVPLSEIDDACGGVAVFHGSGDCSELATASDDGFWLEALDTSAYEKRHVTAQPGQGLLLNSRIVHESMPNRSERVRTSIDFRFFAAPTTSTKHYLDMSSWQVVAPPSERDESK